ncbi:hypothetical protein C4585_03220 [Candidatus Parcubacteria bacterium]|nr:MAG: hypothetical protein C4585_03220 [Candidatus Parcubacteria bacterium]
MTNSLTNVQVTRDDERWEVEIKAEIPAETLETYRADALKDIQATAKLDGFRPGKAPLERILAVYGEGAVLKQAVEHAIQHELPELLAKESLPIVETPRVTTETPERGKSLSFTARAALAPKIELADYKKIAAAENVKKEVISVSDNEHKDALTHLRRERARIEKLEKGAEPEKAQEEVQKMEEKDLPELDDTFVQSLGYENVAVFGEKLREGLKNEKERAARDKRRSAILDELVRQSTISYPAVLREYELDEMEARITDDLSRFGKTFEQYLVDIKKTRDDLRKEWQEPGDKRAKIRLILSEIARKENIDANPETLAQELEHAKKHYPQAHPETLRANLAHAMRNDAVLQWLESL